MGEEDTGQAIDQDFLYEIRTLCNQHNWLLLVPFKQDYCRSAPIHFQRAGGWANAIESPPVRGNTNIGSQSLLATVLRSLSNSADLVKTCVHIATSVEKKKKKGGVEVCSR